jgi:hypothetical protein
LLDDAKNRKKVLSSKEALGEGGNKADLDKQPDYRFNGSKHNQWIV